MIADNITAEIGKALKDKDEIRLSTLRMLSSALNYEFIAKQHKLNEDEEIVVVKKEAKKRTDAIEALKNARGKTSSSSPEELEEKITKEEKELEILKQYLPAQLSDEDLEKMVDEAIAQTQAQGLKDMGKVIGVVMGKAKGSADGSRVSQIVKSKLG